MTGQTSRITVKFPTRIFKNFQVKLGDMQLEVYLIPGLPDWELVSHQPG